MGPAKAVEAGVPEGRITGTPPTKNPEISLDLKDASLADALRAAADKTGWSLIFEAPAAATERRITLRLTRVPAIEVLSTVLELGDLHAVFKDKLLVIRPAGEGSATGASDGGSEDGGSISISLDQGIRHDSDDRVAFGQPLRIEKDDKVKDAVSIGGPVTVAGHVRGSAVSIGGSVVLEPGAVVEEAVSVGGTIDVQPGAILHGNRVAISGSLGAVIAKLSGLMVNAPHGKESHSLSFEGEDSFPKWGSLGLLLVLTLALVAFMPLRLGRVEGYLTQSVGKSVLGGLALLFGIVPVCLLFLITIVGIPLIPLLLLAFVGLHAIGMAAFLVLVGNRVPLFGTRKSRWLALLIGFAIFAVVYAIPYLGAAVAVLVSFTAAGAALLSRVGRAPKTSVPPVPPPTAPVA